MFQQVPRRRNRYLVTRLSSTGYAKVTHCTLFNFCAVKTPVVRSLARPIQLVTSSSRKNKGPNTNNLNAFGGGDEDIPFPISMRNNSRYIYAADERRRMLRLCKAQSQKSLCYPVTTTWPLLKVC
jgi:hypothetical protein